MTLRSLLVQRLDADPVLSPSARAFALEAFDAVATDSDDVASTLRGVTLRQLHVEGFRGIAGETTLDLEPGPGLTLVIGRNGSGKSSMAEALEALMSGNAKRFDRSADWSGGWRNLHHDGPVVVRATFVAEGLAEPVEIEARWDGKTKKLLQGAWTIRAGDQVHRRLADLGWTSLLDTFPPTLSYPELGKLFEDKPSLLYDAVARILGLGVLADAMDHVRNLGNVHRKVDKDATTERKALLSELPGLFDPRAAAALDALTRSDLDALDGLLAEGERTLAPEAVRSLQQILGVSAPTVEALTAAAARLDGAARARQALQDELSERARKLADLLDQALDFPGADCPVCERPAALDGAWRAHAHQRLDDARQRARALTESQQVEDAARAEVSGLLDPVFRAEPSLADWWEGLDGDSRDIAQHVTEQADRVASVVAALQARAAEALEVVDATWRPLRRRLLAWATAARQVLDDAPRLADLDAAEEWLITFEEDLRGQRFAPISERARGVWTELRQESSVEVFDLTLAGRRQRRKLECQVQVDGESANALAVMSQGELMALALGLFIPRMTMDESPFRFVLVDDPVQSLDPHKVDGLALVLGHLAETRQVVVLTHDARLRNAAYRLGIPARVLEAERGERSKVQLRQVETPTQQYLADAQRVLQDAENLGDALVSEVVPTFCRQAFEAAFATMIRRTRLGRGETHADVEEVIRNARASRALAGLALCDDLRADDARVADVFIERCRDEGLAAYEAVQVGSHAGSVDSPKQLIRQTGRAVKRLLGEAP